jgi:hypothetical protein
MKLNPARLSMILGAIAGARQEEIGCDTCWQQICQFAELELAGKDPAEALPLVHEHLRRCSECRDEYEALLAALKNLPS